MTLATFLATVLSASASEGPWTTPQGMHNLYAGVYMEQFRCFETKGQNDPECGTGKPVPSAVQQSGVKVFYRYGISPMWDAAISIPFARVAMAEENKDADKQPTVGLGLVEGRIRRRLGKTGGLDWSASLGVRSGAFHHDTRDRLTNLGEGTTDFSGTVSTGATGLLGPRFFNTSMDATYYYRMALQNDEAVGKIPGDELRLSAVFDYAATSRFGVGVGVDGFHRLSGSELDFAKIGQYGEDRWASLQASQVKAGGRIMLYPQGPLPYLQVSAQRVVWAKNNPTDALFVEVAMGTDIGGKE